MNIASATPQEQSLRLQQLLATIEGNAATGNDTTVSVAQFAHEATLAGLSSFTVIMALVNGAISTGRVRGIERLLAEEKYTEGKGEA